jgi:hypothetical protein
LDFPARGRSAAGSRLRTLVGERALASLDGAVMSLQTDVETVTRLLPGRG